VAVNDYSGSADNSLGGALPYHRRRPELPLPRRGQYSPERRFQT
jgi:hypothetical protein